MNIKTKNSWKNQLVILEEASKFHNKAREIFASDTFFKRYQCYQEVPVVDLNPEYTSQYHRFDWYLPFLNVVIELHGNQHYHLTNYGGSSFEQAAEDFKAIQERDSMKKEAALAVGLSYIEIPYKYYKTLSGQIIKELINAQSA